MLEQIKLRRLAESKRVRRAVAKSKRRLVTTAGGGQKYADVAEEEKNASNQSGGSLDEGKKNHHTPKFIQHCVSAITQDPEKLAKVEAGGPDGEKGSPFAICADSYKKKTRSKAAAHSQGEHHTVKDYEGSLSKLREAVEAKRMERLDRNAVVFRSVGQDPTGLDRRVVRFSPRG